MSLLSAARRSDNGDDCAWIAARKLIPRERDGLVDIDHAAQVGEARSIDDAHVGQRAPNVPETGEAFVDCGKRGVDIGGRRQADVRILDNSAHDAALVHDTHRVTPARTR